ncbi:hypothetical protein F4824DRAFT_502347 [Ustulina deusta]|nr:hypothetical protein F4824DRAFT_502347 [Ustulina deusta]
MNFLGAAFVFFDEAHQYNGTRARRTDPFRFLKRLRDSSLREPSAFTVSASIPMSGPDLLSNIVEHIPASRLMKTPRGACEVHNCKTHISLPVHPTTSYYVLTVSLYIPKITLTALHSSSSPMSSHGRASVFQTTKLLEAVLPQVDMRTLLTSAQLVSRQRRKSHRGMH